MTRRGSTCCLAMIERKVESVMAPLKVPTDYQGRSVVVMDDRGDRECTVDGAGSREEGLIKLICGNSLRNDRNSVGNVDLLPTDRL